MTNFQPQLILVMIVIISPPNVENEEIINELG